MRHRTTHFSRREENLRSKIRGVGVYPSIMRLNLRSTHAEMMTHMSMEEKIC